jgi:apolipoprotein N-acyltransferase
MLVNALLGALPFLVDRLLVRQLGDHFLVTLIFPSAVTAMEFIFVSGGPFGSFGAQAYTQYGFLPFMQFASLSGIWGITFIVAWFASVAVWAVERYQPARRPIAAGIAVYAAVVIGILGFGGLRLLNAPEPMRSVEIASFTAVHIDMGEMMALRGSDPDAFRKQTQANHAAYLQQTVTAAQSGAQIVLWPELAGLGTEEDVHSLIAQGQALADQHDIYLAMPVFYTNAEQQTYNKLFLADPNGDVALEHVKYGGNLLEGSVPGSGVLQSVETPFGTLSAVICWDTDYPSIIRQAGEKGIDILLSPAYVWPEVARIHAEMAPFRAVENGMAVVRQSDNGYSFVVDALGRLIVQENHIDEEQTEGRILRASVPIYAVSTFYPVIGDGVGVAAVGGTIAAAFMGVAAAVRRRKFVAATAR